MKKQMWPLRITDEMAASAFDYASKIGSDCGQLGMWNDYHNENGPSCWMYRATDGTLVTYWENLHNPEVYASQIRVQGGLCRPSSVFTHPVDTIGQADILGHFSDELGRAGDEWSFLCLMANRPPITLTVPGLAEHLATLPEFLHDEWYSIADE